MSKNILILTGSPRKNGNSDMLADAFMKGAQEKGHTVNKIEAENLNVSDIRHVKCAGQRMEPAFGVTIWQKLNHC